MNLEPREGFDWSRVRWSGPLAPVDETCSYCGAAIPDETVPLRLWNAIGFAAVFCDACMREHWGFETFGEDQP